MKKYRREILLIALFALACVLLVLFEYVFTFSRDAATNGLIKETLSRLLVFAALVPAAVLCGYKRVLSPRVKGRALLWCLPCLFVALANFPFSALITGEARVERFELLWLFTLDCIAIGLLEELLFRGILQPLFLDLLRKKSVILAVIACSAAFGAWHFVNLLGGAGIGVTLMQVGYSFLIGAMLSAVYLRTGNIWTGVFLHAVFDFGGLLVERLGTGAFQDTVFWVLTAMFGALCFAHVLFYLIKLDKKKKENAPREEERDSSAGSE